MKLTVLGSNGWFPANGQLTASYILEYKGTLIVIDAGTGIANFNLHTDILEKYDTVHVILSHYHFDHSVGIVYFNRWMTDKHLCFYFPAGKYYQSGAIGFENAIFAKGYNSGSLKGLAKRVSVFEYDENGFTINRIKIKTFALKHSNPSFALNFDDRFLYCTDTPTDEKVLRENSGCALIAHECWSKTDISGGRHTDFESLSAVLNKIGYTGKILLIHKNPDLSANDYKEMIQNCQDIAVAMDNDVIKI